VAASIGPPAPLTGFTTRRRLLISGFVLLVVMASAACYFVLRAVKRERAVARVQSDFVAAVSHEFRTPLTTLAQFTERLREHPRLDEESRRVCYDAQGRATARLTRLVESLLDFGRTESGARRYDFEQTDCSELVQRVVDDFRGEAAAAGHGIEFHRNGPVPVDADREALSRAVWNLIENAVKYSPPQPGVVQEVEVGLDRTEGQVRIAVRDRGIGIPAHERDTVFKRFQRGEQARQRGILGTGIGLAMVAEIVKAHHGQVEVQSQPGEGTTFTIILPSKGAAWRGF
jgi:signal transduction histidine kinase